MVRTSGMRDRAAVDRTVIELKRFELEAAEEPRARAPSHDRAEIEHALALEAATRDPPLSRSLASARFRCN